MAGALSLAMRGGRKTTRKKNTTRKTTSRTPAKRRSNPAASYQRLKNQIAKNAMHATEVGGQVAATAVTQGALAVSAYAAGYMGQGKMRIQPNNAFTDYRVIGGAVVSGLGLYNVMQGKGGKSGMRDNYMLALGSGLLAGPVYEAAYAAGYTMAEKNGKLSERVLAGKRSGFQGTRPVMVSGASFGEADYADPSYSRLSRG